MHIVRRSRIVALGVAGLFASLTAIAAPQSSSTTSSSQNDGLAEVVVTGSRIKRATLETLEPAQVITGEYLEERGLTNVADALNELVSYGVGTTPEGAQAGFGTGVNFVNRFSLGSARTLTLVNGRRFVSSNPPTQFGPAGPGLQVDLNAIPSVLIDRVESIAVGGAPTYGSDAIAGTVNLILKDRYEGVRVFGQAGQTFQGDAGNFSLGVVAGSNFLDGAANITFSVQHSKQKGLLASQRPRFANGLAFAPNPSAAAIALFQPSRVAAKDGRVNTNIPFNTSATDGIPAEVLIANRRVGELTFGGVILPTALTTGFGNILGFGPDRNTYLQFNRQGELVPYDPGTFFTFAVYSGGDGASLVDASQVTSDLNRSTFNLFANVDISDNVRGFFEGTAYRGEALELVDQWGYNTFLFGGSSAAITIPSTHPLLTAQARNVLAANGITSFSLQRAHRDLQTNNGRGETELYRGVVGFRGEFAVTPDRIFDWEVSANFGSSLATSYSQQINRQRFANAMNAIVGPTGQVVCNPAGTIRAGGLLPVADPACVPLDLFGEGRPSPEARAYVSSIETVESRLEQRVFNANIGGELFDTWAGPISFNIGAEQREEEGSFSPNAYLQAGLGRSAALTPTRGSFRTTETFGEFIIPLASPSNDWTLLRRVNLVGKARSVDNTVNGQFTTSTFGVQYQPIEGLELRGNVTKSLRAPSIVELYLPSAQAFAFISHPCDARNITASGTTRFQNCQDFFRQYNITPPFTFVAQNASTLGTNSGNPSLLNEQADSWTAGFVFRPTFVEGLQISADFIDIEIKDVITSLTATQIVTACFDATSYPNNDFCPRIQYTSAGQAAGWSAGYVNGNLLTVAGIVAQVDYGFDLADIGLGDNAGKMRLRADWYYEESAYQITAVGARTDYPGVIGEPRNQIVLSANYQRGPLGLNWQSQYTSRGVYSRTFTVENRDILGIDDYLLHNASASWRFPGGKTTARLAISNVFDTQAPFPSTGVGAYDILGRRFSLSLSHDL